jgi:hypothetical protein
MKSDFKPKLLVRLAADADAASPYPRHPVKSACIGTFHFVPDLLRASRAQTAELSGPPKSHCHPAE